MSLLDYEGFLINLTSQTIDLSQSFFVNIKPLSTQIRLLTMPFLPPSCHFSGMLGEQDWLIQGGDRAIEADEVISQCLLNTWKFLVLCQSQPNLFWILSFNFTFFSWQEGHQRTNKIKHQSRNDNTNDHCGFIDSLLSAIHQTLLVVHLILTRQHWETSTIIILPLIWSFWGTERLRNLLRSHS